MIVVLAPGASQELVSDKFIPVGVLGRDSHGRRQAHAGIQHNEARRDTLQVIVWSEEIIILNVGQRFRSFSENVAR